MENPISTHTSYYNVSIAEWNARFIKSTTLLLLLMMMVVVVSCGLNDSTDQSDRSTSIQDDWLLPIAQIVDGGPGKDGIPSIDRPDFAPVDDVTYVPDSRMVIGVRIDDDIRAYPHQILDWHEIVNDVVGDTPVSIVYCPLTGTGMCWNRTIDNEITEFGVSGLLFRNNLIAYDRNTDSNWSQMQLRSVNGPHIERDIETFQVVETTWETWKKLYPESLVHTTNTGHSRNYSAFTYGSDYATNHNRILFPVSNPDSRLQNKDRVHGILGSLTSDGNHRVKVYPIDRFGDGVTLVKDSFDDNEYLIIGSREHNFAAAFRRVPGSSAASLVFEAVQDELPVIMQDSEGNKWDIFGRAVAGPRTGEQLTPARSYTGYWFAWADFFPGLLVYQKD